MLSELALRAKASNGYGSVFMEACRAELTYAPADVSRMTVAEIDGEVVGVVGLKVSGARAEVTELWVDPDHQGKGIGRALAQWVLDAAPQGCDISVEADPNAVPFYSAFGFRRSGSAPSGSIPGRSLPVLTLEAGGRGLAG